MCIYSRCIDAINNFNKIEYRDDIPDWDSTGLVLNEEMVLITQTYRELQSIMTNYVGIVRSNLRLNRALNRLETIYIETEDLYNKSILTVNKIKNIHEPDRKNA